MKTLLNRSTFSLIGPLVLIMSVALVLDSAVLANDGQHQYLALGDSLATGVGASDPETTAYVPLFHQFLLAEKDGNILLTNIGHSGDTTIDLIAHGHLAAALTVIESGGVEVVTVDIGGNDASAVFPACSGGLTPGCLATFSTTFATFSGNFNFILNELRTALGPDTPIIVMTYYNAFLHPACPLNPFAPLADIVLEGGGPLSAGLNDLIRSIAAVHGAQVADTFGLLGPSNLQPDCLHANDSGYRIIADEFVKAFDDVAPRAVGGTTLFLADGSGSSAGGAIAVLAGTAAGVFGILAVGGWYARRRWLR